ncbi:MAG: DUF2087 domain-containing protein [Chloroflexi bacterium]|nr:DUF2087 domain-containing protein [Chloroflexota bacterium]
MPDIPPPDGQDDPAYEAKVRHAYLRKGRLVTLPARERKRRVILRFLVDEVFPDDTPIPEREVNERLARWHPDFASLRRHLIDAGLATRDGMTYRRVRPSLPDAPADRTGPPLV